MSDETTLLSCPFCGGEYAKDDDDFYYMGAHESWCPIKEVLVPDTEQDSEAWNTRAELGSGTLTAEQVREAIEKRFGFDVWIPKERWQAIADELNGLL